MRRDTDVGMKVLYVFVSVAVLAAGLILDDPFVAFLGGVGIILFIVLAIGEYR